MEASILLGILSLFGSLAGTFGGIMTSNRLTGYRIEQLEKKVDAFAENHNDITARVIKLEDNDKLFEEKIKTTNQRIDGLVSSAK
jgi:cell division protein FtsB